MKNRAPPSGAEVVGDSFFQAAKTMFALQFAVNETVKQLKEEVGFLLTVIRFD